MDFSRTLQKFKARIDKEIEKQFDMIISEAKSESVLVGECLEYAKFLILSGGKRIRGALLYYGYIGAGGKDKKMILKAAAAAELGHLFVLMHDDIIDHGIKRHNVETLNKRFSRRRHSQLDGDAARHFGESIALIIGDMIYAIMNKGILEAKFDKNAIIKGLIQLQNVSITTAVGQIQEIAIGRANKSSTDDVLAMYKKKTARYTFEGPLKIGMMVAGCENRVLLRQVGQFALPIGVAFQIQDDLLGIFGSEKKTGKSVASDIEEGKNTILVVRAREKASSEQKEEINSIFGKKNITKMEIATFKKILNDTGATDFAKKVTHEHLNEGKMRLRKLQLPVETKVFLSGLIQYIEDREQ